MKKILLGATLCAAFLSAPHTAVAFTLEQATTNTDGSAKYTDPDDQKPGLVFMTPDQGSINGLSMIPNAATATVPTLGDNDNGARAFDQAFAHQQSK